MIRGLFIIAALYSSSVIAQQPVATFSGAVDLNGTAEDWNLNQADWEEYLTLMRGPSGLLYASMSPFYVLGVNTDDPARQRHFAERSLDLHNQRFKQVQQFYRVQRAIASEHTDARQASSESLKKLLKPTDGLRSFIKASNTALPDSGRLSAYLSIHQCPRCDAVGRQLIHRGDVDLYFVDARNDDEIRRWATERNINIDDVIQGTITLNNDTDDVFSTLEAGDPPVIFRQDGGLNE